MGFGVDWLSGPLLVPFSCLSTVAGICLKSTYNDTTLSYSECLSNGPRKKERRKEVKVFIELSN